MSMWQNAVNHIEDLLNGDTRGIKPLKVTVAKKATSCTYLGNGNQVADPRNSKKDLGSDAMT